MLLLVGCGGQGKPLHLVAVSFTLNSAVLSPEGDRLLFSFAATVPDSEFIVVQGVACDLGGPKVAGGIARERGAIVRSGLQKHGVPEARILLADPVVLLGPPREQHRRADLFGPLSKRAALDLSRRLTARAARLAGAYTAGGQRAILAEAEQGPPRIQPMAWFLALALAAAVAIGGVFFFARSAQAGRLREHQFQPGERQSLGLEDAPAGAAGGSTATHGTRIGRRALPETATDSREDEQRKLSMAAKRKTGKEAKGPTIRGALDREFAGLTLGELAKAPVSALQGLTPRHARLLEEGFGIKTVEDLSKLKYVEIAKAIVVLSEFES